MTGLGHWSTEVQEMDLGECMRILCAVNLEYG